ncbi:MAG: hypothetical protein KKB21_01655 [Nanoarchaeota archaeon]|nr:hypothetical protein [Nanoarchaeota archaeon]MBU4086262.1 hypothetical protein [Nanoarchaeota archaeon]
MKRVGWLARVGLSLVLAGSLSGASCTSALISHEQGVVLTEQVKKMPYLAMIEGLQPASGYRMKELGEQIAGSSGVSACATSGNCLEHMKFIRQASSNNQQVYIAGFSMGENEARTLAEQCNREKIGVERLFLIDGPNTGKIPENVRKAVDIVGTEPYVFRRGKRYGENNLENPRTEIKHYEVSAGHLDVPAASRSIIESEISSSRGR